MKKLNIILVVIVLICASVLTGCGEKTEDKILGSWYTDRMGELFFSEDGTYTLFSDGGTYSVDGNRITLIGPLGSAYTFEYYDDGEEQYIYDTDGSWVFYPYDVANEIYAENLAAEENQRVSTVDALRDYFIGTWVMPKYNVKVEVYDDGTYKIIEDPYEEEKYRADSGTWSFDQDWNDKRWIFSATWTSYNFGEGRDYTDETVILIPDYEDGDFSKLTLEMHGGKFVKE